MRPVFWLIPPLLGFLGYLAGPGSSRRWKEATPTLPGEAPQLQENASDRLPQVTNLEDLQKALDEACRKERDKLLKCSPAELRELILRLQKATAVSTSDDFLSPDPGLKEHLEEAIRQLGKLQGEEGVEWVKTHAPKQRLLAMDGWAESDPERAFEAIAHSSTLMPSSPETLLRLLQRFGEADPALMKARAGQVPWELFISSEAIQPPAGASVTPWIESGAALEMSRLGLDTNILLNRWMREKPAEALAQWLSGTELPAKNHAQALADMLIVRSENQEDLPKIQTALNQLSPEDLERVKGTLNELAGKLRNSGYWQELYPYLFRSEKPAGKEDKP